MLCVKFLIRVGLAWELRRKLSHSENMTVCNHGMYISWDDDGDDIKSHS